MLQPAQPHSIHAHKAEHLSSQMALRVEATRFLQHLHPTQVQLLEPLADFWRQLTCQPDKRRCGRQLVLYGGQRLAKHLCYLLGHGVWIIDLLRQGIDRRHWYARRQHATVAVQDTSAFWVQRDTAAVLTRGQVA